MKTPCILLLAAFLFSCGGGQSKVDQLKEKYNVTPADPYATWESNNGIGPITSLELPGEVDSQLADQGLKVYEAKCTACHKPDKKFIGPAPQGILSRRTPAWVMNMILNPEEMLQKDPIAKKLFVEYNGSPMANQNLTEDEARAVLEYFRTL